jgi:phosphatidylglycerol---prolipoprotein diacylglyceryl transferase
VNQALLAFIPSPESGAIRIGSLQLRAYGLMIALGVIAAVWLTGRRIVERGIGKAEDASAIALWAVPAGIIGARIYHVITDPQLFQGQWYKVFYVWEGGLGIWGGIGLGVAVGLWVGHRRGLPMLPLLDAAAPALALAQAIGRWGNYWNQELFGRPTTLPWGLEIDIQNRPDGYTQYATFHPTFLYESLWNLALCGVLLLIDRRHRLRPGRLFVVYVAGYTFARFFIERVRIDTANKILGLRVNEWVSAIIFLAAAGFLAVDAWLHRGDTAPVLGTAPDGEPAAEEPGDEPETVVVPEGRDEPPDEPTDNSSPDPAAPS